MHNDKKSVLLISMPFAETSIPSIQLALLEEYLKDREIQIKTAHLYLKAAEFYGLLEYNYLINNPNDPYTAQMFFSKYVFPKHWETTIDKFKDFFYKSTSETKDAKNNFSFERYVIKTDKFFRWIVENIDWKSYDIIGFSLNYGQLLPSLAFAKKIKERSSDKKIIFGGSRTVGELGKRMLDAFEYVDFIASGDGENILYRLASDYSNYESIPNLIYRKENKIVWNESNTITDLDSLPICSFDSFYNELSLTCGEVQQYFSIHGRLPIEMSRGCWWNKCSFCNIGIYNQRYREKNVDKIVEEIRFLSDNYKMLTFQLIGNTLPKKNYDVFFNKLKELNRDFTFFAEARAGRLKSKEYTLLKEAGIKIVQTGVETFSQHYLKKMNKGTRVIDNIAALKFCKENNIDNAYNIVINCPNEEKIDYEETKKTFNYLGSILIHRKSAIT